MTQVLLTVDVELSSSRPFATEAQRRANMQSAILGGDEGRFGLPYQLDRLNRHGLKGVFFVEALCADVWGPDALARIVGMIRDARQEIQLHAHTEWLRHFPPATLAALGVDAFHDHIGAYPRPLQVAILRRARANLIAAGAPDPIAFRAGNFGAGADTPRALADIGIAFDSSYNACLTGARGPCGIEVPEELTDPCRIDGTLEVPVTHFDDRVLGLRPLQLCSVSLTEMRDMLVEAARCGRKTAVAVSHSFELLNLARSRANRVHVARFDGLCAFLAARRDTLPTAGFADLDAAAQGPARGAGLRSSPLSTLGRMGEQLFGRIYG